MKKDEWRLFGNGAQEDTLAAITDVDFLQRYEEELLEMEDAERYLEEWFSEYEED